MVLFNVSVFQENELHEFNPKCFLQPHKNGCIKICLMNACWPTDFICTNEGKTNFPQIWTLIFETSAIKGVMYLTP